jgi:hypothetical protein
VDYRPRAADDRPVRPHGYGAQSGTPRPTGSDRDLGELSEIIALDSIDAEEVQEDGVRIVKAQEVAEQPARFREGRPVVPGVFAAEDDLLQGKSVDPRSQANLEIHNDSPALPFE